MKVLKKIVCSGVFGPTKTIWVQNIEVALLNWALMGIFSLKDLISSKVEYANTKVSISYDVQRTICIHGIFSALVNTNSRCIQSHRNYTHICC